MKNKILSFLEKNIINVSTLIILLVLIVFISNSINNYTLYKYIETSFDIPKDYNTFITNYYQTQANWLIFWLTLLACLTAIIGLAIPFVLNQSYREKIKEMECEFQKQLKDLDNYKKQSAENLKTLKNDVKLIKNQAEQSKTALPKMLTKELSKFKEKMQYAIDEVKQDAILFEIKSLEESSNNYRFDEKREEELRSLNKIIYLAEKAKKQLPNSTSIVNMYLERAYYSRGLIYQYVKKEYINAISDFLQSKTIFNQHFDSDNETVNTCLLYCYAQLNKYDECNKLLDSMENFSYRSVDKTIKLLERYDSTEAQQLLQRIKSMAINL